MNDENNNVQNVNNNEKETIQNIVKNQDPSNQNMQVQITTNNNSNDEDSDTVNLNRVKDLIIAIILSILVIYFGRTIILDLLAEIDTNSNHDFADILNSFLYFGSSVFQFVGTIGLLIFI